MLVTDALTAVGAVARDAGVAAKTTKSLVKVGVACRFCTATLNKYGAPLVKLVIATVVVPLVLVGAVLHVLHVVPSCEYSTR